MKPEMSKSMVNSFADIDEMPSTLRACVHEFGYAIVDACRQSGVVRPANISQLVHAIWEGARQPAQRSEKGYGPAQQLDWLLIQAGAEISAARLLRFLAQHSWTMVPLDPTTAMVEASKGEVSGFSERVTKTDKHKRRLRAAIKAAAQVWEAR